MGDEFTIMTILGNSEINAFTNTDEDKHKHGMRIEIFSNGEYPTEENKTGNLPQPIVAMKFSYMYSLIYVKNLLFHKSSFYNLFLLHPILRIDRFFELLEIRSL